MYELSKLYITSAAIVLLYARIITVYILAIFSAYIFTTIGTLIMYRCVIRNDIATLSRVLDSVFPCCIAMVNAEICQIPPSDHLRRPSRGETLNPSKPLAKPLD